MAKRLFHVMEEKSPNWYYYTGVIIEAEDLEEACVKVARYGISKVCEGTYLEAHDITLRQLLLIVNDILYTTQIKVVIDGKPPVDMSATRAMEEYGDYFVAIADIKNRVFVIKARLT